MSAYYNENDEFAADWLRNLIKAGLIADGEVDTRSIVDVRPGDLRGFGQCHFFAGIGGWSYALRSAGWPDDIAVWTGSCPCQPFSLAGKQKGFSDERHLWPTWRELIRECNPAIVFGEQVASATEWLGLVRGDLEAMGRAVGAVPIQAASAGADHLRDRYWFVAHTKLPASARQRRDGGTVLPEQAADRHYSAGDMGHAGCEGLALGSIAEIQRGDLRSEGATVTAPGAGSIPVADADQSCACTKRAERGRQLGGLGGDPEARDGDLEWVIGADGKARRVKSGIRLLAHGVPNRVGLLRGFGNAIDHRPAKDFIIASMEALSVSSQHHSTAGE